MRTTFVNVIGAMMMMLASILSRPPDTFAQDSKKSVPTRPTPVLSGFKFTSGENAPNIPFELYSNIILLKVKINKSQPLSFIFFVNSRVKAIQIGSFSLENPILSYSEDTEGGRSQHKVRRATWY